MFPSLWAPVGVLLLGAAACAHGPAVRAGRPAVAAARARAKAAGRAEAPGAAAPLPPPPVRVIPLSPDAVSARLRRHGAPALPAAEGGAAPDPEARVTLDADLARLTRVLGSLRAAKGRGRPRAPRVVVAEWSRMVGRLDAYLDQAPARTPAPELVRTRIVVETELRHDEHAWRLPGGLVARIRGRLAYLDHRLAGDHLPAIPARAPKRIEWPIDPVVVNSPFGMRTDPISGKPEFHEGMDLNGQIGEAVTAAAGGIVTWAGWRGGYGNHIEIAHGGGWATTYSHLSKILVERGQHVEIGDLIGLVGSTGRSTGPHLHFEILHDGHPLNPETILGNPAYAGQAPGTGLGGP